MDLKEKASYIIGLLEGLNLDFGKEKNKLIDLTLSLIKDMASKIEELESICLDNAALIDELDQDLASVESDFVKSNSGCKTSCKNKIYGQYTLKNMRSKDSNEMQDMESFQDGEHFGNEDEYEKEDPYEVSCPNCSRVFEIDEEVFKKDDLYCPECGEKIEFDFKDEQEGD